MCFEQSDHVVNRVRTEVHVALRRRQIAMSCELLNRTRRRTSLCEMRAERVPKNAYPHGDDGMHEWSTCER